MKPVVLDWNLRYRCEPVVWWMFGWVGRWMVDGWWMDRLVDVWVHGTMDRLMDGWMGGWMGG